ncbi:hypothetical protein ACS0TY_021790 [Phlomoides rotata]
MTYEKGTLIRVCIVCRKAFSSLEHSSIQIMVESEHLRSPPPGNTIVEVDDQSDILEQIAENDDFMVAFDFDGEFEIVEQGEENTNEGDNEDDNDVRGNLIERTGNTIEDIYTLHCRHARVTGFSVRKGTSRKSTTAIELARTFRCSCAGVKEKKLEDAKIDKSRKQRQVGITRTDCKAFLNVKRTKEGIYEVVKHKMNHNHVMTRPEWGHYNRSERNIMEEKGKAIEKMISSGMRVTKSYHYMAYEAGGEEALGHTKRDHYNYVSRLKMEKIESGDAQTFIDTIHEESEKDQDFFSA